DVANDLDQPRRDGEFAGAPKCRVRPGAEELRRQRAERTRRAGAVRLECREIGEWTALDTALGAVDEGFELGAPDRSRDRGRLQREGDRMRWPALVDRGDLASPPCKLD